jgi:protein-S-isoprenylcysteine O-methyltransferase Ste14
VRPVVIHNLPAGLLLIVTTIVALVTEGLVRKRFASGGSEADDSSLIVIAVGSLMLAAVAWGSALGGVAPFAGGIWWPVIVGFALMWSGLALRIWAVATLGSFFKLKIVVQDGQRVVDKGPYRVMRHPAYLATIVYSAGSGIVLGYWVAFVVLFVGTSIMLVLRIRVEERVLVQALGSEYVGYMQRTARLVPGVY